LELNEERGLDARALADSCVALVSEGAATAGIVLATEFEAGLPPLIADGTRLKQILLNLLGNAVKFTEPGGSVMLAGHSANDGGVEFEIRDTGLGMTAAEIGIAIEPFGQVDAGLAHRREGTGLGLPLARRLTERHGGSFTIESVKGRGTRVVVGLPPSRVIRDGKFETLGTADGVRFAAASPLPVG
jgi:signal transduction histidine kinase